MWIRALFSCQRRTACAVGLLAVPGLALLLAFGWHFDRPGKGDHLVYARGAERISIPYRRGNILAVYVRRALQAAEDSSHE